MKAVNASNNIYHPKLLKIFSQDELDLLIAGACYSLDRYGQIDVIIVNTDKIIVEIYTDCEAKEYDHALITLLEDCGNQYPESLSKEKFWEIFIHSSNVPFYHINLDL